MLKKLSLTVGILCCGMILATSMSLSSAHAQNNLFNSSKKKSSSTYRSEAPRRTGSRKEPTHQEKMAMMMEEAHARMDARGHARRQIIKERRAALDQLAKEEKDGVDTRNRRQTSSTVSTRRRVQPAKITPYNANTNRDDGKPRRLFNYIRRN